MYFSRRSVVYVLVVPFAAALQAGDTAVDDSSLLGVKEEDANNNDRKLGTWGTDYCEIGRRWGEYLEAGEIPTGSNACDPNAECVLTDESSGSREYKCVCKSGYKGYGETTGRAPSSHSIGHTCVPCDYAPDGYMWVAGYDSNSEVLRTSAPQTTDIFANWYRCDYFSSSCIGFNSNGEMKLAVPSDYVIKPNSNSMCDGFYYRRGHSTHDESKISWPGPPDGDGLLYMLKDKSPIEYFCGADPSSDYVGIGFRDFNFCVGTRCNERNPGSRQVGMFSSDEYGRKSWDGQDVTGEEYQAWKTIILNFCANPANPGWWQ